ncbi:hypothetical protein EYC84_004350 [Monilinia fructicola]|uniref:Uncharacterized protein n=1 Tax=Monilinia fructicola TaxID=38448 RepID=A0A5M9K2X7_MONFR|nr:hypothetical protein EYC84_004350 [Monilinia fructicola]
MKLAGIRRNIGMLGKSSLLPCDPDFLFLKNDETTLATQVTSQGKGEKYEVQEKPPGGNTFQHPPCVSKFAFHRIGSQPSRTPTFFTHPSIHISSIPEFADQNQHIS